MTRNSKADLQRKLAMAPVAKPPAGLADRIKRDIPKLGFTAESEQTNLRKSAMFNLRIAASIVLLASSLYLALHLLSRNQSATQPAQMIPEPAIAPSSARQVVALPNTPPEPGSARTPPRSDLPALPSGPPRIAAAPPPERISEARRTEADGIRTGHPTFANDAIEIPEQKKEQPPVETASAASTPSPEPLPAAIPPTPPAAMAQAAPMQTAEGGSPMLGRASADGAVAKTTARERETRDATPPVRNFVAVQQAIARGETPREADTAAVVQHFAAPDRTPAELRVELEASATPLDATKWLLRVSVDAPAATQTTIDLEFGAAVASHHALAGSPAPNTTALYEIEFTANAQPDQTIANVRAGKAEGTIRVADLHPWNAASSRMKRASLAAAWTRTKSRTQTEAIVAKAREAHIDELVDMAESAAARIR